MVIDQKYELTELVGEGAMGWVYRGLHRSLQSTIAVKLMKPSGAPDEARDQRFAREARAASRLNNPHIISIIDFGSTPGGLLYIVSEYLRGQMLSSLLLDEPELPIERTLQIMDQVLSAVDEAHGAGLVHRDLKPDNIIISTMRSGDDFVKVLDFGIAKLHDPGGQRLTMQGQLFGTPAYMAPEQIRGHEVTARTDLYACSLILYEMLTGQEAFQSEAVMEVLSMQLHNTPPPFREVAPRREIPAALEALVMRGLAKDPADRFASASEMRDAMHAALGHRRQTGPIRVLSACGTCGQPLAEGSKFCTHCGARQSDPENDSSLAYSATMAGDGITGEQVAAAQRARESGMAIPTVQTPARGVPSGSGRSPSAFHTASPSTAPQTGVAPRAGRAQSGAFPVARAERPASVASSQWVVSGAIPAPAAPLVGREAEVGALEAFFGGERRKAQLLGAVGCGRSRLLDAAHKAAQARDLRVVKAESDPEMSRAPWFPVRCVAAQLLGLGTAGVSAEQIKKGALSVGLSPFDAMGLVELFGVGATVPLVEHAVRRRETQAAALRLVRAVPAAREGLCLLLDDVDEYDGPSLEWVGELLEEERGERVFVILAGERSLPSAGASALTLHVSPLSPQAIERMGAALGSPLATSQVSALASASQGMAFHVVQSLRLLGEGGTAADLPLDEVIAERLGRLSRSTLGLLQAATMFGRRVPLDGLRRLCAEPATFQADLQRLEQGGYLARHDGGILEVAHALLVAAVQDAMPAETRRTLHQKVLKQMQEEGSASLSLARHAVGAQAYDLTVHRDAGQQAEHWLDDAGASQHFRRALQVARWELLLEEGSRECLEISLRLGETLRFSGDLPGATIVFREALGAAGPQPDLQARHLRGMAGVHLSQGEETPGLELLRDAVRAAIFSGSPDLLCDLYTALGRALLDTARPQEAVTELNEGVAMVTGGDGPDAKSAPPGFWRLLLHLGEAQIRVNALQAALDAASSGLGQARRLSSLLGQARSHFVLGQILDVLGQEGAAAEHYDSGLAAFRLLGDRQSAAECLLAKAARRPTERHDLARLAMELAEEVRWWAGHRRARSLLGADR